MSVIISFLQLRKVRLREVEQLLWGHTDLSLRAKFQDQCQHKCALEVQNEHLQKQPATAGCYECLLLEAKSKTDSFSLSYSTMFFIVVYKLQLGISNAYIRVCLFSTCQVLGYSSSLPEATATAKYSGKTTCSNKILCGDPKHKIAYASLFLALLFSGINISETV